MSDNQDGYFVQYIPHAPQQLPANLPTKTKENRRPKEKKIDSKALISIAIYLFVAIAPLIIYRNPPRGQFAAGVLWLLLYTFGDLWKLNSVSMIISLIIAFVKKHKSVKGVLTLNTFYLWLWKLHYTNIDFHGRNGVRMSWEQMTHNGGYVARFLYDNFIGAEPGVFDLFMLLLVFMTAWYIYQITLLFPGIDLSGRVSAKLHKKQYVEGLPSIFTKIKQKCTDSGKVQKLFDDFGFNAEVEKVNETPYIKLFKINIDGTTTLKNIESKTKEIARVLKCIDARVDQRNGYVFIEVTKPRDENATILEYKDVSKRKEFKDKKPLDYIIGETANGDLMFANFLDTNHIFITGTSGSGKSTVLNGIINSLVSDVSPNDVQFRMSDLKGLELPIYERLPHMNGMTIATTAEDTIKELEELVIEMYARNYMISNLDGVCRNLAEYNNKASVQMPYLIYIVDELAEVTSSKKYRDKAETLLTKLAKMGRASGIFLIVCTQKPTSNTISTDIKDNLPTKIALKVENHHTAQYTIPGADKLPGKGAGLFLPLGVNTPIGFQAPNICADDMMKTINDAITNYHNWRPQRYLSNDSISEGIRRYNNEQGENIKLPLPENPEKIINDAVIELEVIEGGNNNNISPEIESIELALRDGYISTNIISNNITNGNKRKAAKIMDGIKQYIKLERSAPNEPYKVITTREEWEQIKREGLS